MLPSLNKVIIIIIIIIIINIIIIIIMYMYNVRLLSNYQVTSSPLHKVVNVLNNY